MLVNSTVVALQLSHVWLFATPWTAARQASLSFTISPFAQTHVRWVSDAIQPSHPLSPPSPLALNLSQHQSFPMSQLNASGGQRIGPSASASVLPMNILDWFPLGLTGLISLLSKGLKSLPQHHSSKASTLQCSVFFMVQLSHPYMSTGETSSFWLDRPLLAKWCLYFLIHSIGFS